MCHVPMIWMFLFFVILSLSKNCETKEKNSSEREKEKGENWKTMMIKTSRRLTIYTFDIKHILLHICILIICVIFIKQTDLSIRICISHWILTNKYWLRSIYNMYCICNKQQVTVTRHLYMQIYRHLYLIATHPSIHRWDVK